MADVAKRLAFEDLSLTLRLSDATQGSDSFDDVRNKISNLASAYDQHCKKSEQALSESRSDALKLIGPGAGGLAAKSLVIKRQLQSLKSSLLNLGQKELFSEAILNFNEMQDYRAEAERCAAAVEAAEEDLKDLKKENQQDEEHLNEAIRMIETYHEQHQQVMARIAQRLAAAAKELAAVDSVAAKSSSNGSSALSPPPTPAGVNGEEELDAMISQQAHLATSLESQLAKHEAGCQDLEGDLAAQEAEIRRMEAEIAQVEAMKEDESKRAQERHTQNLAWCDALMELVSKITGVSIEAIEEDSISLRIALPAPQQQEKQQQQAGGREVVLRAMMEPGTTLVCAASATPSSAVPGLPSLVAFVKGSGGGLPLLLTLVKSKMLSEQKANKV